MTEGVDVKEKIETPTLDGLKAQWQSFVVELVRDPKRNATQAAIRAGYPKKGAHVQGSRLLRSVKVQAAVKEAEKAMAAELAITPDRVLKELAAIAFARPKDYTSWGPGGTKLKDSDGLTDDQAAAVAEVSEVYVAEKVDDSQMELFGEDLDGVDKDAADAADVEKRIVTKRVNVKFHNKTKALELMARHFGMLKDKIDVDLKADDLAAKLAAAKNRVEHDRSTASV